MQSSPVPDVAPEPLFVIGSPAEPSAPTKKRRFVIGLQARIVFFFVLLMLVVQVGGIVVTSTIGRSIARQAIGESLETGAHVFERLLAQMREQLLQSARVLASDYAFREAVATNDGETLASALANHGARIKASTTMLVGLDRRIVADAQSQDLVGQPSPFEDLITVAERERSASAIALVDGRPYQIVVVPVLGPRPIAWVVLGFAVDDRLALDLGKLTTLDVSFASRIDGGTWNVNASTLPPALGAELVHTVEAARSGQISNMSVGDDVYLTLASRPAGVEHQEIVVLLQKSLQHMLEPFDRLRRLLLVIAAGGLLVSLFGSIMIARGIAEPVRTLAAFARRIGDGDYGEPPHVDRHDEIGDLASAFEHMGGAIATREERIATLAFRDTMTGLPNRALFTDRLRQAIGASQRIQRPLSVMMMDLDRFKHVNDSLGHHLGDLLLCEVAARLQGVLRRQSDTVARLGGDEFAILLPTDDTDGAMKIAREIIGALERPMSLEGQLVDIRGSIGIASFPMHGNDSGRLMQRADVAMYLAKRQNTGFAVYDVKLDESTRERLSLMGELRQAVEHDELLLYFQPKVRLSSSGDCSAEALIRWQHPTRGLVPPNDFIPFAERTGYIKAITTWVLDRAIQQCAAWRRGGDAVHISVNISARDLMSAELPAQVAAMLERHGCKGSWLGLEIVESSILDDPARAIDNLERLRALGCRLAIDDYGTGYSSLSYLKRLPVHELKIDRSFVMAMMDHANDAMIVKSTIDLGHNMDLEVVAEGVEDLATLERLRALGCDYAQGYALSRPLGADAFVEYLRRQAAEVAIG